MIRQCLTCPGSTQSLPSWCVGLVYAYMEDLLSLDRVARPSGPAPLSVWPDSATPPLDATTWQVALWSHPDKCLGHFLVQGLRHGFRIGYNGGQRALQSAKRNMPSAYDHPEVIDKYLANECHLGRVLGPFTTPLPTPIHVNRFGVIPKKSQPGKWRLIVDLSFPEGGSVNDGINPDLCSLRYPSVDLAIQQIRRMGEGALLSKLDIKEAYRIVPVHPEDWPLLGMCWKGNYYVDTRLPFGLRSAPKLFTALADAAQWLIREAGVECVIHYLDDYLFVEPPQETAKALGIAVRTLSGLGIPLAPEKVEGPSTHLTFLGIELDSTSMTARLPGNKLERLQETITAWQDRKACTKRELLSLVGVLQHATMVVRHGRVFLRRMIELAKQVREYHHFVRLNREFRSDLQWWRTFLPRWNGISFLPPAQEEAPAVTVYSDASGGWGYGAWCQPTACWFQGAWPPHWQQANITAKELLPVAVAAAFWGSRWRGQAVHFRCDNAAIVHAVRSGRSTEPLVMQLLRGLHLFAMEHNFHFTISHVAGSDNGPADALSRNKLPLFLSQVPHAPAAPDRLPQDLLQLFLAQAPPDWLSDSWRQRLTNILDGE